MREETEELLVAVPCLLRGASALAVLFAVAISRAANKVVVPWRT